jgi:hypothetical protein
MSIFEKILVLLVVSITYGLYGLFTVSDSIKTSKLYYLGILFPVCGNLLWLFAARRLDVTSSVVFAGLWDLVVAVSYPMAAIFLTNTVFTPMQYVGMTFFIIGAICFRH